MPCLRCSTTLASMRARRRAVIICLAGVDGSGKTTQARRLASALTLMGTPTLYLWNRWEPRLLAPLMDRFRPQGSGGLGGGSPVAPTRPNEGLEFLQRKRRLLRLRPFAWVWLTAAYLDFLVQARGRFRQLPNESRVVVTDRYVADFQVDQAVNLGGSSGDLERVTGMRIARGFPRPAAMYVLTVDPVACARRKWDGLTPERLAARQSLYKHLVTLGLAVEVSADADEERVAKELLDLVLGVLREDVTQS